MVFSHQMQVCFYMWDSEKVSGVNRTEINRSHTACDLDIYIYSIAMVTIVVTIAYNVILIVPRMTT